MGRRAPATPSTLVIKTAKEVNYLPLKVLTYGVRRNSRGEEGGGGPAIPEQ